MEPRQQASQQPDGLAIGPGPGQAGGPGGGQPAGLLVLAGVEADQAPQGQYQGEPVLEVVMDLGA